MNSELTHSIPSHKTLLAQLSRMSELPIKYTPIHTRRRVQQGQKSLNHPCAFMHAISCLDAILPVFNGERPEELASQFSVKIPGAIFSRSRNLPLSGPKIVDLQKAPCLVV